MTGYSVALRPREGQRAAVVRRRAPGARPHAPAAARGVADTPEHARAARAEWQAARRGQAPVAAGREARTPSPAAWARYTTEVTALREQLRSRRAR